MTPEVVLVGLAGVLASAAPILFGVIKGRRRLYFVGDWVDEFCDLTFDQIADALGKDNIGSVPKDFVVEAKAS